MKMKNYYWKDVIDDLHAEGKTPADQMQELIGYYKERGDKYASTIQRLQELDEHLKTGEPFRHGRAKTSPENALLDYYCDIATDKIDKIYKNAKMIQTPAGNGSFYISTELTEEEHQDVKDWSMGYYELETIWERITRDGEHYTGGVDIEEK